MSSRIYELCSDEEFLKSLKKLPPKAREIYEDVVDNIFGEWDEEDIEIYFDSFANDVLYLPDYLLENCQSVPEIIMSCALNVLYDMEYYRKFDVGIKTQYVLDINGHKRIMDFAIISDFGRPILFVECDGYSYHASTPEQFDYTQEKDREVQSLKINVLHFTGRDILGDPMKCAREVFEYVKKNYSKSYEIADYLLKHNKAFTIYDENGEGVTFIPQKLPWNTEGD